MNSFRPYVPGQPNQPRVPFATQAALLELPQVKQHEERPRFYRFELDESSLIAVNDFGSDWKVVGYIERTDELEFPKFRFRGYAVLAHS